MGLWVPFLFGAGIGALVGYLFGRRRRPALPPPPRPTPRSTPAPTQSRGELHRVAVDEGAANVLNALNNRLAAIGALADLLREGAEGRSGLDPERQRALLMLHGEVRRAAEITQHFLELTEHPVGAAEPSDPAMVLAGVLAERETTLKELAVRIVRIPAETGAVALVACPRAQLGDILTRLVDFALRRLREASAPRELRLGISEIGPSVAVSLWDSGAPLSVEAEQRLVSPFRFTHSGGGGEIEFALARALVQSSGGSVRLRQRGGGIGAEVVVTIPKSVLGPLAHAAAQAPTLPRLRILVVDDDAVNREAMRMLLEREGHDVVAVEDGLAAAGRLAPTGSPPTFTRFDAVVTDLQMPRLGGRALYEQVAEEQPQLARRFVFVTGDGARADTRTFLEDCGQPAVLKPYELQDLLSAIGAVTRRGFPPPPPQPRTPV
jgi:CheY-like chemotaxis protein